MSRKISKTQSGKLRYSLLGIGFIALGLCGCFQATNKFYSDSDILTDKRFVGHFGEQATNKNSSVAPSLIIAEGRDKHYVATFQEGAKWIKLDAVFFKCGTNTFVDISHLADNGRPSNPGNAPTALELVGLATTDKTHSAFRVNLVKDGIEFQFALYGSSAAVGTESNMKIKMEGEGLVILLDPTDKLRTFLAKMGNDDSLFKQKSKWVRKAKQ